MATRSWPLVGKKILYIGSEEISPEFLADEASEITITEGTTEIASQAGTLNIPNGSFDELTLTLTIHLPSARFLGKLFPNLYTPAEFNYGDGEENETGVTKFFAAGACTRRDPVPIILHNACDTNSAQDIRVPQGLISTTIDATIAIGDPTDIDLTVQPLPGTDATVGAVEFGEGNLDAPSLYDPDTQEYVPVEES